MSEEKQKFYLGDKVLLEVSTGFFVRVEVTGIFMPGEQKSFGQYRYIVEGPDGRGALTVTASKLSI
mgnify:CR=1 FL=1